MAEQDTHKTLEGGAIDYAHYIERGRTLRSEAAFSAFGKLRKAFRTERKAKAKRHEGPAFPLVMATKA